MPRYSYRIETNYGTADNEAWDLSAHGARSSEDYDGTIDSYAQTVLNNWISDLVPSDDDHGQWRVLAWCGETDEDGLPKNVHGTADNADANAQIDLHGNGEA